MQQNTVEAKKLKNLGKVCETVDVRFQFAMHWEHHENLFIHHEFLAVFEIFTIFQNATAKWDLLLMDLRWTQYVNERGCA